MCQRIGRISKFQGVTSLTIFFPSARGADTCIVSYIGLKGDYQTVRELGDSHVHSWRCSPNYC